MLKRRMQYRVLLRAHLGFRKLRQSSTVRSALSFGCSGLSFAIANLLFAHVLPVEGYATLALIIAIVMLGSSVGMLGADGVVNRNSLAPEPSLFWRVSVTSSVTAVIAALFAVSLYELTPEAALLLLPIVVAFAITRLCGAWLQARLQFGASLLLLNSMSYGMLLVAVGTYVAEPAGPVVPLSFIALFQVTVAVCAVVFVRSRQRISTGRETYSWHESLAFLFMASSAEVMVQLERLITPQVLELEELATLGVLLAIVGPPFRLLYLALGYDLLPALRHALERRQKAQLILRHSIFALLVSVPIWILVWFLLPWLQQAFLSEDYALSNNLILAALIAGTIKGFSGIARAGVTALASVRGMEVMGIVGWTSIAVAIAAAGFGAQFGLAGVIYAVSLGWAVRLAASLIVVLKALDDIENREAASAAMP